MNALTRTSIRARLVAGAAASTLTLLVVGSAATLALRDVNREFTDFTDTEFVAQADVAGLRQHVGDMLRFESEALINIDDVAVAKAAQAHWRSALAEARKSLPRLRSGGDAADVDRLEALLSAYEAAAGAVIQDTLNGRIVTATEAFQSLAGAHEHSAAIAQVVGKVSAAVVARGEERRSDTLARSQTWLLGIFSISAAAVVAFVVMAWLSVRAVGRPLARAVAEARRMAQGDLSHEIQPSGPQECADLLGAMATMQASLREMLRHMQHSSHAVATASAQIAAGNGDLSQRTDRTAAELQRTASEMQMLARSVADTETTATTVTGLAHSATRAAEDGHQAVGAVAHAMEQLDRSAGRISEITGTIHQIALQTRLLALNAAVEAARAGEQGRGFSVVAQEVGELAGRASRASDEIAALVGQSVEHIGQGTQAARDAGARMERIIGSVREVAAAMKTLQQAAAGQSGQILELSGNVNDVEESTSQNAALVQQSASTSETLREQAQRLEGIARRFQLAAA